MVQILHGWGYQASQMSCYSWLQAYYHDGGGKAGSFAVLHLSRQALLRWYHVDGLSVGELCSKLRADGDHVIPHQMMQDWLQKNPLPELKSNDELDAHAAGGYAR